MLVWALLSNASDDVENRKNRLFFVLFLQSDDFDFCLSKCCDFNRFIFTFIFIQD